MYVLVAYYILWVPKRCVYVTMCTIEPLTDYVSLIPRPFPPPVFDWVCKKQRGKAWEIWSRAVTSGRQTDSRYIWAVAEEVWNNSKGRRGKQVGLTPPHPDFLSNGCYMISHWKVTYNTCEDSEEYAKNNPGGVGQAPSACDKINIP